MAPLSKRRQVLNKIWAILRVATYLFVVCSVVAVVAIRSAYGDAKEQALFVGKQLTEMKDLVGSSHRLKLNGETIYVASAITDQSVSRVLDRFEQVCAKAGTGLAEEFQKLPVEAQRGFQTPVGELGEGGSKLGIIRDERDYEGMVACLVRAPEQKQESIYERLQQFADSGDLGDVGQLRYAYARHTDSGKTHVVTSWTEGSFQVRNLAPPDGREAPGSDPANATRPLDSTRLLTAEIEGAPYAVRVYDASARWERVLQAYDREMGRLGWQTAPYVAEEVPNGRAYSREGVDLLVFADENGDHSVVSVVEMRSE